MEAPVPSADTEQLPSNTIESETTRRGGRRRKPTESEVTVEANNRRPLTRRGMVRQQTGDADFQRPAVVAAPSNNTDNCAPASVGSSFDVTAWLSGGTTSTQ